MSLKFKVPVIALTLLLTSTQTLADIVVEVGKGDVKSNGAFSVSLKQLTVSKRLYNNESNSIDFGLSLAKGDTSIDGYNYKTNIKLTRASFNIYKNSHITLSNNLSVFVGAGISLNRLKSEVYDGRLMDSYSDTDNEFGYGFKFGTQYHMVSVTGELRFYPELLGTQESYINIGYSF